MIKVSLPTALVFGWHETGTHTLESDVYFEEGLFEDVVLHCYDSTKNLNHLSPDRLCPPIAHQHRRALYNMLSHNSEKISKMIAQQTDMP